MRVSVYSTLWALFIIVVLYPFMYSCFILQIYSLILCVFCPILFLSFLLSVCSSLYFIKDSISLIVALQRDSGFALMSMLTPKSHHQSALECLMSFKILYCCGSLPFILSAFKCILFKYVAYNKPWSSCSCCLLYSYELSINF